MSLNRIVLMGRLARDPELRHTQSGVAVASFTLAVDRDFKDGNGQRTADFIDIVAWRQTGEFAAKYLAKGRMAAVEGRLQLRDWTATDGSKRRSAEVVADSIYFADSKKEEAPKARTPQYDGGGTSQDQFSELEDDDGELPF